MEVRLPDKSIAIKLLVSVSVLATTTDSVLVLRVLTAWPTVFAWIAEMMLIALPETLGVEISELS